MRVRDIIKDEINLRRPARLLGGGRRVREHLAGVGRIDITIPAKLAQFLANLTYAFNDGSAPFARPTRAPTLYGRTEDATELADRFLGSGMPRLRVTQERPRSVPRLVMRASVFARFPDRTLVLREETALPSIAHRYH